MRVTTTSLSRPLLYVASCNVSFQKAPWVCEKEGENLPSAQKTGYLKTGIAGVHLPGSHGGLLQLNTSSSSSGTHQWLLSWQGRCLGQDPWLCSVYNLVGPHSRSLGATVISALLSHNNNKSTCFMRFSGGLEKADSVRKGTQSFLAGSCPVNFKAGSSDRGQVPQVTEPGTALLGWSGQSWCRRIKQELTVLNFLFFTPVVATRQPREALWASLRAWENQCV